MIAASTIKTAGMDNTVLRVSAATAENQDPGYLRLRTLIRLRWLAIFGQTATVLLVHYWLGFSLPLSLCLGLVALSAWINIFLTIKFRATQRLSAEPAALLLGYDIAQLAGLLYLTGGLKNPFTFLFLVPVTVSAASLPVIWTLLVCGFALLTVTFLAFFHWPLPWLANHPLELPATYVAGLWVALVSGTVFSAIYARRISEEARQMSAALTATELVLAREQRLSALDGLAAAAAHELGTPLATIALVAKELRHEFPTTSAHSEDFDLLVSQAARCREILSRLSNREEGNDEIMGTEKLSVMIENLVAPLRGSDVVLDVTQYGSDQSAEPKIRRNPAITYGLGNLLENAIDFAEGRVEVRSNWSRDHLTVTVADDGPGFDPDIMEQLGDPFVTTRPGYSGPVVAGGHEGMGLGLFIAKTLLQRSGAQVVMANREDPHSGASIRITWPRTALESSSRAAEAGT
jgi:two-component system, sensor histidine kinase RegB